MHNLQELSLLIVGLETLSISEKKDWQDFLSLIPEGSDLPPEAYHFLGIILERENAHLEKRQAELRQEQGKLKAGLETARKRLDDIDRQAAGKLEEYTAQALEAIARAKDRAAHETESTKKTTDAQAYEKLLKKITQPH